MATHYQYIPRSNYNETPEQEFERRTGRKPLSRHGHLGWWQVTCKDCRAEVPQIAQRIGEFDDD